MSDLIDRQAVNDLISKFIIEIHTEGGRDLNAHTNDVLRQILRNINSDEVLPSVNPQEPKTGHWIYICNSEVNGLKIVKCSECSKRTYGSGKYCPNCGCRMDAPQERSEKE